ncbi:MAG: hypothetical protein AAF063_21750 [Cyanobacteria bacterium J06643_5]
MSKQWEEEGQQLAEKLKTLETEEEVKLVCENVMRKIAEACEGKAKTCQKDASANVRKIVRESFPVIKKENYFEHKEKDSHLRFFTNSGKGKVERYEHLAIKYLSSSKNYCDKTGDKNREQWNKEQAEKQIDTQAKINLNDMTLEKLDLDIETKEIAQNAMNQLNISLAELLKRSITFYSKTVVGKAKRNEEDLSHIPTEKLLEDKEYSTHPNRADELTKRAIVAIRKNNNEIATVNNNRWCITQSAIATLTGSKPATIGKTLKQFEGLIDDHNQKYKLNGYSNRKGKDRDILQEIDLVKLVPDGIDLNLG